MYSTLFKQAEPILHRELLHSYSGVFLILSFSDFLILTYTLESFLRNIQSLVDPHAPKLKS